MIVVLAHLFSQEKLLIVECIIAAILLIHDRNRTISILITKNIRSGSVHLELNT